MLSSIQKGASDIHIEPYEKEMRIRFRIDGVLHPVMSPPLKYRDAIVSRVKIMARLDIAEKRLPQDGRIKVALRTTAARPATSTSVSRSCRRSSAKRSCCGSSTPRRCGST